MFCAPTANTSANSERDALKPVVFALAMLLAVTERSDDAAFRPLKATANGMAASSSELVNRWLRRLRRWRGVVTTSLRISRTAVNGSSPMPRSSTLKPSAPSKTLSIGARSSVSAATASVPEKYVALKV